MPRAWTAALVTSSLTNSSANSMTDPSTRSSARTLPVKTRALRTLAGLPRNSTALAIDFSRTPSTDHLLRSSHAERRAGIAVRALGERLRRAASSVGGVRVRIGRRRCGRVPPGDDVPLAREPPPRSAGESSVARRGLARRPHLVDFVRSWRWRVSPRRGTRHAAPLPHGKQRPGHGRPAWTIGPSDVTVPELPASTEQDRARCATGMSKGAQNARTLNRDEALDLLARSRQRR